MGNSVSSNVSLMKRPSAFLPLVMSFICLALVLVHAARFGIVHEADEGTEAHIFQLLMVAEVSIVAFFAFKWLPRTPAQALRVLALQAFAAFLAFATVFFLT